MPFIASNGTRRGRTSKTIATGGMRVNDHDVGAGETVLFFHSYRNLAFLRSR
jgi:hypothetical protein